MGDGHSYLQLLDRDPDRAAEKYGDLWLRLVKFFEWRDCGSPEDLAQETLARGFRRIADGVEVDADSLVSYFFGVARNVVHEDRRNRQRGSVSLDALPEVGTVDISRVEARICLQQCFSRLSQAERELLLGFYADDRRLVARRLHLTANALRVRAHRARKKLERLIQVAMTKVS
jgi:RNA polymerase sigma-70 factor (ECF subfamily)